MGWESLRARRISQGQRDLCNRIDRLARLPTTFALKLSEYPLANQELRMGGEGVHPRPQLLKTLSAPAIPPFNSIRRA